MDLSLIRFEFRPDGIFSKFLNSEGNQIFVGLEHAYYNVPDNWFPKLVDGDYKCVRGMHRLEGMTQDFETFEITNVPGHTGILIHAGNFNFDSDGCVLIGISIGQISGRQGITQSKAAFQQFMNMQLGCDEFVLSVKSA